MVYILETKLIVTCAVVGRAMFSAPQVPSTLKVPILGRPWLWRPRLVGNMPRESVSSWCMAKILKNKKTKPEKKTANFEWQTGNCSKMLLKCAIKLSDAQSDRELAEPSWLTPLVSWCQRTSQRFSNDLLFSTWCHFYTGRKNETGNKKSPFHSSGCGGFVASLTV